MDEIIIGKKIKDNRYQQIRDEIAIHLPTSLPHAQANDAASNLFSFFELLIEIDREHGITSPKQRKGQP